MKDGNVFFKLLVIPTVFSWIPIWIVIWRGIWKCHKAKTCPKGQFCNNPDCKWAAFCLKQILYPSKERQLMRQIRENGLESVLDEVYFRK